MSEISRQTVWGINFSDPDCFRSLYDEYYSYLCGVAASFIGDFEKSRELVNDVFLRVWARRLLLKYPPLPYLFSAVRNACYNYLRDNRKTIELSLLENIPDVPLYDEREVEDLVELISEISSQLPDRCREVFDLHFNEGMDAKEIAERLNITPSTVRVQLKIALDKIREKMK